MAAYETYQLLVSLGAVALAGAIALGITGITGSRGSLSSPHKGWIFGAALASYLAMGLVIGGGIQVDDAHAAAGPPLECEGDLKNLSASLTGWTTVLGIQGSAFLLAAGIGLITSTDREEPLWPAIGAVVCQVILIPSIIGYSVDFKDCLDNPATAGTSYGWLIASFVAMVVISIITGVARANRD